MLSIILFGRNDDHGYNYHKRLAISLNCLAELLTDATDEIIFVDYNTSNELPTIVEAIQDTLTEKAKKLIKIFRVRPHQHARFKTHLSILEPVARNVGIRRSNPQNKWILSTNVDMILVPQEKRSLTEIVASLEDGYYSLPRFELPENLWELSLKRLEPMQNISFLREYSSKLHLNTIVRKEGFIQFDNPGDFQLMLRKDLFEMGGFNEEMLKGWHVDSNLARRMFVMGKTRGSLEKVLRGYHCNHTQKESVQHSQSRTQNNWSHFVGSDSILPIANGADWGLENEEVEEVVQGSYRHPMSVVSILEHFPKDTYEILHAVKLYNHISYSTPRIFAYLIDHFVHLPKTTNVVYVGHNLRLMTMIEAYMEANHFTGKLLTYPEQGASLVIFDFGFEENIPKRSREDLKRVMDGFVEFVTEESISPNVKFIGININYTDFNVLFSKHLSMRLSSYITGSSYGYVRVKQKRQKAFPSVKKSVIFNLRYILVRYFFKYSDRVRALVLRTKLSKIL